MSGVEWTDAERDIVARAICGQRYSGKPVRQTDNPLDHRDAQRILEALAPFVAAREEQAAEKALRRVLGLSHLYDPVTQAHNAALMQRGPQGRDGGMP